MLPPTRTRYRTIACLRTGWTVWYRGYPVNPRNATLTESRPRPQISLFDADCCGGPDTTGEYAQFLRNRFGETVEVKLYRVGGDLGFTQVPGDLARQLFAQGANTTPLLAIDGELVVQGSLPNWIEAIKLVTQRLEEPAASVNG